jgi:DNA replication protein DnaC
MIEFNEIDLDAEWRSDRLNARLAAVRNRRPARLRHPGDLDPRVDTWSRRLVAGTAGNLALFGGVGTGKTWSAWEALERAVAAGWSGTFDFATSGDWQDVVGPPPDRERLRAMRTTGLLVLDDLGSSRIGDWQRECLLSVIDERWAHARPTVITSNLTSLGDPLGERLASRLLDGAVVVALGGPDRRRNR